MIVNECGDARGGDGCGLSGSLSGGLAGGLSGGLAGSLSDGLAGSLSGGLAGNLSGGLAGGLVGGIMEEGSCVPSEEPSGRKRPQKRSAVTEGDTDKTRKVFFSPRPAEEYGKPNAYGDGFPDPKADITGHSVEDEEMEDESGMRTPEKPGEPRPPGNQPDFSCAPRQTRAPRLSFARTDAESEMLDFDWLT